VRGAEGADAGGGVIFFGGQKRFNTEGTEKGWRKTESFVV